MLNHFDWRTYQRTNAPFYRWTAKQSRATVISTLLSVSNQSWLPWPDTLISWKSTLHGVFIVRNSFSLFRHAVKSDFPETNEFLELALFLSYRRPQMQNILSRRLWLLGNINPVSLESCIHIEGPLPAIQLQTWYPVKIETRWVHDMVYIQCCVKLHEVRAYMWPVEIALDTHWLTTRVHSLW